MTTWWTSDFHFGHSNILKYCSRPFHSIGEHDAALVANFNSYVEPEDDVYILGDFSFCDPRPILERMNGRKYLCLGNHDKGWKSKLKSSGAFTWIEPKAREVVVDGVHIWISHYPAETWPETCRYHFHGHSHGGLSTGHACGKLANRVDVGVDCWEYGPVTLAAIQDALRQGEGL